MSNEYAVRCGDAPATALPDVKRAPLSLTLGGDKPNVHFRVEEVRAALWAEPPAEFLDLLEVAAYVYAADQACSRGADDDARYGPRWRRRLHLAVPVRRPEFWRRPEVGDALVAALGFLTEDEFLFHFEELTRAAPAQRYFEFGGDRFGGTVEEVVLFSGGLDSLAGAAREVLVQRRQVALVHHRSCPKIDPVVQSLVDELGLRAPRVPPILLPVRLTKDSGLGRERTLRSRSFAYAALAGAMAHMLGLSRLRFYENGVVSVNLPLATQVVGSRASRTTHPRALRGFERLLSLVAGRPFEVENPFQWSTKANVARAVAEAGCADLIGQSRSCAHPVASSGARPHCGACSQCLDRRFAVLAAGLAEHDPAGRYKIDLLTGVREQTRDQATLAVYTETALRLARCNQAQFFARYGEAARVLGCFLEPAESVAVQMFELNRRHGRDVKRALDDAVRAHSAAIVDRSLPAGCLVRMVLGSGAPEPPVAPAEPPPAENVFRRSGKAWQVRFAGGREFILLPSKGAAYLHLLLQRPDRPISAADLMLTVARRRGQLLPGNAVEVVDREALTAYRARYQELVAMIDKERKAGDSVVAEQLERERVALLEEIQKVMGRKGKPRKATSDRDKVRVAVRTAIRRALVQIRVEDRRLADHLSPPRLLCGYSPCYRPDAGVVWDT